MSWYFEDFRVDGKLVVTEEQVINESDVMAFAELSGDKNPLHTDAEFARNTPMGQRVAHGLMALSVATGLSAKAGHLNGTALAFLGIENWRFHAPVFFGDSIRMRWSVIDTRPTSNGQAGVVKRKAEIINQKDDVLQSGVFITLVRARGEHH